jgi:hypothetical protein
VKRLHALPLVLGALAAVRADAAGQIPAYPGTEEYRALAPVVARRAARADRAALAPYKVLLVPGLATAITAEVGKLTGALHLTPRDGFLAPFHHQIAWMRKAGIDFEMVPMSTVAGCEENGRAIAAAIRRSPKKVLLVSQSKGGVDILYALVRHPEVLGRLAGWAAYQPPHAGSILADLILQKGGRRLTYWLFDLLRGSGLAIEDMTTAARKAFNAKHASAIERIARSLPIVTLVTTESAVGWSRYLFSVRKGQFAFLAPFVKVIAERGGGPNDGIASVAGTCLRHATCFYIEGIDHFAAVMNTAPFKTLSPETRVTLFRTMLEMVARRARGTRGAR